MIETTITKIQYDADGVQRRWSIPFPYADVKHISIYTKVGEEPTVKVVDNYEIDEDDEVVIYPTEASEMEPLAAGTKITIARETPETQLEDASQVHFTSKDVERGLDKLTMITQELSTTSGETMEVSAAAFEAAEEAVNTANEANATANEAKTLAEQAVSTANDANTTANAANTKADNAVKTANDSDEKSTAAVSTANAAKTIADEANNAANEANTTAEEAKAIAQEANTTANNADKTATDADKKADNAVIIANNAKDIAEGIDAKATQALANSNTAVNTANSAKQIAEGIDGKATQALADSATALETATQAKQTADSYQGPITTLRNDVDDLGDQVAAIESKIPAEATAANQLADKAFVTEKTDELAADVAALDADKQDKIVDLDTIRAGAAKGATALQSYTETDPTVPAYVKAITQDNISAWNAKQPAGDYATNKALTDGLAGKQDKGDYATNTALTTGLNGKQNTLTTAQLNAVNSGITSAKVTSYDNYATAKQDKLTAGKNITISADNVISATGGGETPTNMVTTDTYQEITARKDFNNTVYLNSEVKVKTGISFQNGATGIKSGTTSSSSGVTVGDYSVPVEIYTSGFNINTKHPSAGAIRPATLNGKQIATVDDVAAAGGGSGFDFEGTKAEFDAAVTAGTITDDSVSLITDDVSGDTVATKADLAVVETGMAKADLSNVPITYDYVIESKYPTDDDPSWYRKYKSGWLEQGGLVARTSGETGTVQTLLKPFANANYTLTATARGTFDMTFLITSKTATTFSCAYSSSAVGAYDWRAEGMGAN